MGGRVERDLVPGGGCFRQQWQIFFVVARGNDKKCRFDPCIVQSLQHRGRCFAGAVVKSQADPFFRWCRRLGHSGLRAGGRCEEFRVRHRGQIVLPAANERRRTKEIPEAKPKRRAQEQQCCTEQKILFGKPHLQNPPL